MKFIQYSALILFCGCSFVDANSDTYAQIALAKFRYQTLLQEAEAAKQVQTRSINAAPSLHIRNDALAVPAPQPVADNHFLIDQAEHAWA